MKLILIACTLLLSTLAKATNYYFSTDGDDSRSASQARNPATPWKSISKLNAYFYNFQNGDSALLKRGDTFKESIRITKSANIVIGAYGEGRNPIISGLAELTGWRSIGGGMYETYNPNLGESVNVLLINGKQYAKGRWPNTGYRIFESHHSKSWIKDNELSSNPGWTGGEVVIRPSHWVMNTHKIINHSGGTITYSGGTHEPRNDYGYFIQNHIKTLDQFGEWCYNGKKVTVYFGDNNPSNYTVHASAIDELFHAGGKSGITVTSLIFKGANENAIDIHDGSNITIKDCVVNFSGANGITITGCTNGKVLNCIVNNSGNDGIRAGADNVIRGNEIRNTYFIPGAGQNGDGQGAGIRIGRNSIADGNKIINSGFMGIQFGGDHSVVKNNVIDTFCFVKDDGGAIYCYNGANLDLKGRQVVGNIVLHGLGAWEGTNAVSGFSSADGIYTDDNSTGVNITGNTVAFCNRGYYIHNSRNIVVRHNTGFANAAGSLHIKFDYLGEEIRNVRIAQNTFVAKNPDEYAIQVLTKKDDADIRMFGTFDSNYYARPVNPSGLILTTTALYSSSQVKRKLSLAEWKSRYNEDAHGKVGSVTTSRPENVSIMLNTTDEVRTIGSGAAPVINYRDIKGNDFIGAVLQPYSSLVVIKQ